ncbi:MAG: Glucosamine-6-phosphate deaminase [Caldanaerobacter subterraneus]|jgi:glucosamine-6-phosphate deaminase|uniref:Glucosamine-6-phosphate deaminase n=1 Tax=Thermoanaerobacter sp. (strain X514) TaxID=399726 RepID=NAGB_THEPX|nr:glucosamine-6-phosphate deaminase [Thermoanaerobacter sp. X514]B0K0J7.1 RecName: Full=Glucosamine-6-phosphate deaminase; AltName: Full=GlcN6P deaminase; Short=GNPDA; AltName: Full=Glucosamine-6-phosphate isomerase [Thermoanaerobacter sp. X514]KUJ90560.1 MAG: glucosamine-6-phosphate deaminase [Thermoanaerobacter thermocopriae]KUK34858.1 MAG: Glucosamine-6-phosphate deaminase [Caldanaerobacter subterraneus]MBZ4656860.1 glucosamine-6-phosphate isomerase [Thermoanaerobacter sp.]ABY92722.1 gluco
MKVIITVNYEEMSKKAAEIVKKQIKEKPNTVLGLATGSTPLGMYKHLIEMYKRGEIDFSNVITFNLDEYIGLSPDHPQSYHYFMFHNFFNHINIKKENVHIPNGIAEDLEEECRKYEEEIEKAGGIDLQILGIGINGHIGFNEPDESIETKTHVVTLTEKTINANKRFFKSAEEVPRKAITMGLGSIMKAKKIVLLASGKNKAEAIKETIKGQLTTKVPATVLALHHDVTIIIDKEAASLIPDEDLKEIEVIV